MDGNQLRLADMDEGEEYRAFEAKFKAKKTTDECHTPPNVYEAVADWVAAEYGVDRADMVRPFFPGGDYERFDYLEDCTVVDNPPFSILSKIIKFYNRHGIRYFLFAPGLTNFQARDCSHIVPGCNITYENGAQVRTGFLTNLDERYKVRTAPDLREAVQAADDENKKNRTKELPKYIYPDHVLTAARVEYYGVHGVDYRLAFGDGFCRIGALDAQKAVGKSIFGGGYLLSERAAAERAAAERWELSERELTLVAYMSREADS